jgi:hypothetical protein
MSNETEVPLKMLISTEDINKHLRPISDTTSIEYIILQNNKLHALLSQRTENLFELRKTIEELENEVDSLTKSRTCLQGYLKNEVELAQNWKKMTDIYKDNEVDTFKYALHSTYTFLLLWIFMMISYIYDFNTQLYIYGFITLSMSNIVYMCSNEYDRKHKLYHSSDFIGLKESIHKIEKSNMYIQELVDNI